MNKFVYLDKPKLKSILKANKDKTYVYGLCKESGELYYVGIGVKDRVLKHNISSDVLNNKNRAKINTYLKYGCKYVIFCFNSRDNCALFEKQIISKFGRIDNGTGILTNMTDGGEGVSGAIISEDTRLRKSKNAKENSELYRQIAIKQWQDKTPEELEIIRKEKSDLMRLMWDDPEKQIIFSTTLKKSWDDPIKRQKRIDSITKAHNNPELKLKHSQRMKELWENPAYRETRRLKIQERRSKKENLDSLK